MADAESLGQFKKRYDCRVSDTAFEAREILLAKARTLLNLFLRETFFAPEARKVAANQFAHIHAQWSDTSHTLSLSTIICS